MAVEIEFTNLREHNAKIRKWADRTTPEQFDRIVRKIAVDVLSGTVELTPVLTGRLRGGWQLDVGRISESALGEADKAGWRTISQGLAKLRRATGGLAGKVIYIYNNVEYAVYIEFGTDTIAPFAMLRTALSRATAGL